MASSTTSQKGQISECTVCLNQYDSHEHIPKILKCGHTFCGPCLTELQGESLSMRCPSCRVETKLKSGTDLPKNFALLETLECSRSAPQKQALTEICDACAEEIAEDGCVNF